jgi:hypothetical protein
MVELLSDRVDDDVAGLVELGLNHEQQHQELLLMDIKHVLSCNPLRPVYRPERPDVVAAGTPGWLEHPGGVVEVGHDGKAASKRRFTGGKKTGGGGCSP